MASKARHGAVAGDGALLRRLNSHAALNAFKSQPLTVTELARSLQLSRTSAEGIAGDLVDMGWICPVESGREAAGPGRPARRFAFRADVGLVAGLEFDVHMVLAKVTDLRGTVLGTCEVRVPPHASASQRLAAAGDALTGAVSDAGATMERLWFVGVGTPGCVSNEGIVYRIGAIEMPGWEGLDLAAQLSARWGIPVSAHNGCFLGALAEHHAGAAQGLTDVLYVFSGDRTSAGLILNGRPYRGHNGGAGVVGELAELRWESMPERVHEYEIRSGREGRAALFQDAAAGEPEALRALSGYVADLALGISALVLAVDPELVVLGGAISRQGDLVEGPLIDELARNCTIVPRLQMSELGAESVSLGAALMAIDAIDEQILLRSQNGPSFATPDREALWTS